MLMVGQETLAISTIKKMMNIHIDRYVMVNTHGLKEWLMLAGITVNNTLGFHSTRQDQEPFAPRFPIGVGE